MDELLTMSKRELTLLEIMQRIKDERLTQKEAAGILGLSVRQVKRLFRAFIRKKKRETATPLEKHQRLAMTPSRFDQRANNTVRGESAARHHPEGEGELAPSNEIRNLRKEEGAWNG